MSRSAQVQTVLLKIYLLLRKEFRDLHSFLKTSEQEIFIRTRHLHQVLSHLHLENAKWDKLTQVLEEVSFTDGKIYVRGKLTARGTRKRADYILYYKPNIPVAIIEAKDNNHSVRAGIQQGLDYATILDIPCVFSSNGDGFLFHDRTATDGNIETEIGLSNLPTPANNFGRNTNAIKALQQPMRRELYRRTIILTVAGGSPATISKLQSTAPLKQLPTNRTGFCW